MVGGYIYLDKEMHKAIVDGTFATTSGAATQTVEFNGALEYFQNIIFVGKPIYSDSIEFDTEFAHVKTSPFTMVPFVNPSGVQFTIDIYPIGKFNYNIDVKTPNSIRITKEN